MSDTPHDVNNFPVTFLIGTIMIALSVLILCQFKKMEKKKETVLSVSHFPTAENSDSIRKVSKFPGYPISLEQQLNSLE